MSNKDKNYTFPWGFHLGDLHQEEESMPLYTNSNDGGFCLLYDKSSEKKADTLLESLCLDLLSQMPHESLRVSLFDVGKKKFYSLSPLKYIELYDTAYTQESMSKLFSDLEKTVVSRHKELLCCNRQTIDEHNQKSKMKQSYRLVLLNLEDFPSEEYDLRKIQNFIESSQQAGVYIIAFGNHRVEQSKSETVQAILQRFKTLKVTNNEFDITPEIFEFRDLLVNRTFKSLDLTKQTLLQEIITNADLEKLMDPENIKLETNTKVI